MLLLPHRTESARRARRVTRVVLRRWGLVAEDIERAVLVVSELVTDSLTHGLPPLALGLHSVESAGMIRVEVTDGGAAAPRPVGGENADPVDRRRGARIVARLTVAHGTRTLPDGITRWAYLRCSPAAPAARRPRIPAQRDRRRS
ncbi:ATP-binding protein [Streptomyces antibioticus]|uniref:ATP-binding protein n=1 Tax=Streptomyces antibioticus TaxID=1890 RepID=UPI0033B0F4EA